MTQAGTDQAALVVGEPAPWFHAPVPGGNPRFAFDTVAGRHVLLLFHGGAAAPDAKAALDLVLANRRLFDDAHACFFGITPDPADAEAGRVAISLPGIRHFLDADGTVAAAYRFATPPGQTLDPRCWVLLDPMLRILARLPLDQGGQALRMVAALSRAAPIIETAPVLVVPNILEPGLCRQLIEAYKAGTPETSGFMRELGGKTTLVHDRRHKVRSDCVITDPRLSALLRLLMLRRLAPMIARAFQFRVTRMERSIVACYEAETGGHFAAHRDNTTRGTAHRRFAVTINLNAEEYEGGDLSFPEFGDRRYRAPTGGAVVFSCSLLHQAWPVTAGTRYAFLPFLYDDAAAQQRQENNVWLGDGTSPYAMEGDRIDGGG